MATFSESFGAMWRGMESGLKVVFCAVVAIVLIAMIWGIVFVLRDDYATLFTQLNDGDAAAIVDALKKQKVPFKLTDGGATITVPAARVHETRLGLMSGNVSLSGNVGFEIFDKQGLGATEQSQRVSFQRALQGELSRTISALENVKQARVHLVLPESSLFKRDKQEATAAVTLTMRPGFEVDRQQILGVQRLIAASVPGLDPSRVTITDHRGVTLSAATDPSNGNLTGIEARLELQRQVETHIAQKVAGALDRAYGPGQAIISVAVALSFDAIKTTTQDLIPVRGAGGSAEGGVTRRRQTISGTNGDTAVEPDAANTASKRTSSTSEIDYDYGRRMEEVIAAPGAIKRMTIGVIVPPRIGTEEQARLREFVLVAAGVDVMRGDLVSIQSLALNGATNAAAQSNELPTTTTSTDERPTTVEGYEPLFGRGRIIWTVVAVGFVLLLFGLAFLSSRVRQRSLTAQERNELLGEIKRALGDEPRVATFQTK